MITFSHIPLEDFLAPHNPKAPQKQTIEDFEKELKTFLEKAQTREDEEYQKNEINKFLNKVYGYDCNTKSNAFIGWDHFIINYICGIHKTISKEKYKSSSNEWPEEFSIS
ncbi:type IIS restriction /modification enzyme, N-terminal half [Helicobacter mustelae]|uniref:DUF7149 domain-containing protein n=1 Tax=Helicobacter mustelae TaxID=217 RepID=UPI000E08088E|nr:hypothetical protein [Helicobacter mustelae]STP11963.1 type IIS restriction /modification enzyme, N-terminal half [Helicobacter mustelae]